MHGVYSSRVDRISFSAVAATKLDALANSIVAAARPQVAAGANMQNVQVEQIRSALLADRGAALFDFLATTEQEN